MYQAKLVKQKLMKVRTLKNQIPFYGKLTLLEIKYWKSMQFKLMCILWKAAFK